MKKTHFIVFGLLFVALLVVAFVLMNLVASNSAEQHLSLFVVLIAIFIALSVVAFVFVEGSNQSKREVANDIPPSFLPW